MGLPAKKTDQFYTYADYLTWDDDKRWEIINGKVYAMVPAPAPYHQEISIILSSMIYELLKESECKVYASPIDVILTEEEAATKDSQNVVQPDIIVVCDESTITKKGIIGAPDICIEIISPSTGAIDMKEKFILYEKFGVEEYWLVHPEERTVTIFTLDESGQYGRPNVYAEEDIFEDKLLKGLKVDLSKIFKKQKESS